MGRRRPAGAGWVLVALAAPACAAAPGNDAKVPVAVTAPTTAAPVTVAPAPAPTTPTTTVVAPATTTSTAVPVTVARPPRTVVTTAVPAPAPTPRSVAEVGWVPFATAGAVTLTSPAARVERFAFHESNHDGARPLESLTTPAVAVTLETRERGTAPRSAVDIVADPEGEIRAPVSGTVKRAGTYVLYCEHSDDYVVIAPDDQPGWEVKLLHIDGVRVGRGDRVTAGTTVIAPRPTRLPFESQVDEVTADPHWPHVHLEVVDPSVRDRPSPGGGCN